MNQEQYYCTNCRKLVNWIPYIKPKFYHVPVAMCKECEGDICIPEEDWIYGISQILDECVSDIKKCRKMYGNYIKNDVKTCE